MSSAYSSHILGNYKTIQCINTIISFPFYSYDLSMGMKRNLLKTSRYILVHADSDYGLFRLLDQDIRRTANVSGSHRISTPNRHLSPDLASPRISVCLTLNFVLLVKVMRSIIVRYLNPFMDALKLKYVYRENNPNLVTFIWRGTTQSNKQQLTFSWYHNRWIFGNYNYLCKVGEQLSFWSFILCCNWMDLQKNKVFRHSIILYLLIMNMFNR